MTHHTEAERAEFELMREAYEKAFGPPPVGAAWWASVGYVIKTPGASQARAYAERFKGFIAGWVARRAPAAPVISEAQVLAITTAYEQGVGKGHQSHARKEAITNPYGDEWGCDSAWQMGYDEGREQAERKAAPQPPEAAPVQMPEGVVVHAKLGRLCSVASDEIKKGEKLYTEHQVRQLLARIAELEAELAATRKDPVTYADWPM